MVVDEAEFCQAIIKIVEIILSGVHASFERIDLLLQGSFGFLSGDVALQFESNFRRGAFL